MAVFLCEARCWFSLRHAKHFPCAAVISGVRGCIRMGAQVGRGKYGTCCALPDPLVVRHSGSWGAKSYNESVNSGAAVFFTQFDVGKRPAAKESGVKVLIFFQPVI